MTLTATSQFDTGVTDSVTDDLEITPPIPSLVLLKTVDAASAVAGDILTYYTITYQAAWLGSNDLTIRDTIPAGLSYEAGTLRLGTRALTDVSGDDEGYHDQTAGVIEITVPAAAIQPEDSVSFQVRVLSGAHRNHVAERGRGVRRGHRRHVQRFGDGHRRPRPPP